MPQHVPYPHPPSNALGWEDPHRAPFPRSRSTPDAGAATAPDRLPRPPGPRQSAGRRLRTPRGQTRRRPDPTRPPGHPVVRRPRVLPRLPRGVGGRRLRPLPARQIRLRPTRRRLRSVGRGVQRDAVLRACVASRSDTAAREPCPHGSVEAAVRRADGTGGPDRAKTRALGVGGGAAPGLLVAVSPSTAQALRGIGVSRDRIRVVHNGVEEPGPRAPRSIEPLFVAVGRLVEYKRIDLLLRLWERVRPVVGGRLLIVGDGPERERLERLAGPGVEFTGHVSEARKHELLCAAWLLLHPSAVEGGGWW